MISFSIFFNYIDPGTGSLIISLISGLLMTFIYTSKDLFYKLMNKFSGRKFTSLSDFSGKLVFFSEGQRYWNVFEPVILKLIEDKQPFVYLTADKNDQGLSVDHDFCEAHFIGNINQAIGVLNVLKAAMCVMTTPQLNVVSLKRSKNVKHYSHLIHSPTDIHAYKKFAFDYFDSVLCSSSFQIDNLRKLEENRSSKRKVLLETGCTYYDNYKLEAAQERDSILVAPTWGDKSFFSIHGQKTLKLLLNAGFKIIYRPHPQSWISDKILLESILEEFSDHSSFSIDREISNENSISKSFLMICDMSGVVYDFAFTQKKPVMAFNFSWDDGGYESSDIEKETSTILLLNDIGKVFSSDNLDNLINDVKELKEKNITDQIINKHIYNFRKSGSVAKDQILSIYKDLE